MMSEFIWSLLETTIKTVVIGGVVTGIAFLFKEKFKALIQYSIKYAFDRKLEDYKAKEVKRQKAILIADLISEWISFPQDRKRLNQLTLEAFIWLPKDTATKLSQLLSHEKDSPQVRDIVAEVRKLILGDDEVIDSNKIILFPPKEEKSDGSRQQESK